MLKLSALTVTLRFVINSEQPISLHILARSFFLKSFSTHNKCFFMQKSQLVALMYKDELVFTRADVYY